MTRSEYLAHVKQSNSTYYVHELSEHLKGTANLASIFASNFGNSDWGFLVGLWHDLGKYQADFQRRIKHHSGYDPEAHLEGSVGKVDHSTAGALYAIKKLGKLGHIVAYMIAGHHAGLTDWKSEESGQSSLAYRLEKKELLDKTLAADIPEEILNPPKPTSKPKQGLDIAFWIRMLFSCLVDADFLDTENFMDDRKAALRSGYPTLEELFERFDCFMQNKINNSLQTPINQIRRAIFSECEAAAESDSGLFSLTVPTGGGKTLSSMAFALRHALKHKKRRIIYVIPYTSIIEQTADIFREIFADAVIEQHSNIESSRETVRSRLAYENWDAPIIVTTSVQFFESLFSNRTSRVRKLHNIVESVVILDEAQLLPPDYLLPILHTIKELQQNYGVSFVICTATQPALEKRETADFSFSGLSNVKEIISEPTELHQKLKRVEVIVPQDISRQKSWQEVAQELQQYSSVLCVVNSRKDCRELFSLMPDTTIHLSALMCGQHRSEMIRHIKSLLKSGQNVRVISTQLVEAGVDLDFPVVYR
ncbi:MAG: CRISPR-associated endonuclease Cas3'', partial [Blastocatellia bacterium]|nr:CRISPR-associated endonuclease Cas3'' [Blastocatellia bacterium]